MRRVLAIWLDGFDWRLAEEMQLPNLARLRAGSAVAELDSGGSQLTGLTAEHLATGLDPAASGRAHCFQFDPSTYTSTQVGSRHPPVFGAVPTVVLDQGWIDLVGSNPNLFGLSDWGSNDPGFPPMSQPAELFAEVEQRFGTYPARPWLYGTPWASSAECAQTARDLVQAVHRRSSIASWLLAERLPDWQLAIVAVSEGHSAIEAFYHGIDPSPRWRSYPTREVAADGLRSVYAAIDQLIGDLVEQFPDDLHVVFSLHGMGPNFADVPSLLLIGELLARWSGEATPDLAFPVNADGLPLLPDGVSWGTALHAAYDPPSGPKRLLRQVVYHLPARALRGVRRFRDAISPHRRAAVPRTDLGWIPLMRHQPHWPAMRAFAVPSLSPMARVRVNVKGREASGCVDPAEYGGVLDELEALLRACRDPTSGAPLAFELYRPFDDPMRVGPSDSDLMIEWREVTLGFTHPSLGTIGPVPQRRTGGHVSPVGGCLVHGPGVVAGDLGRRSSFDVVPTLLDLAGSPAPWPINGHPLPVEFVSAQTSG